MGQVNKDICLAILKRAIVYQWIPVIKGEKIFSGPAGEWKESADPKFLEFLRKTGTSLNTKISLYEQGEILGEKIYCVTINE